MTAPTRRILILMSDTGGGHRSVAQAIIDACERKFPGLYQITMVDVIKRTALFPFNHAASWYLPFVTYAEFLWSLMFRVTNHPTVFPPLLKFIDLITRRRLRQLLREQSPDLVLTTHPIFTHVPRRLLREIGSAAPMVTVVCDLIDIHLLWFDPAGDLCILPTEGARTAGRRCGMPDPIMHVVGLPISAKFTTLSKGLCDQRTELGLAPDYKTVLLVGGGEGMGRIYDIARAIARTQLPLQLVVIAGRNRALQSKLDQVTWEIPVSVQGFVTNMADWMHAADLIITKAGPNTIMEALACGLPIILSGFLPGQETGNATFVEQSGVGVLCQDPDEIAHTLGKWLEPGNNTLECLSARARQMALPDAAFKTAQILNDLMTARGSEALP